MKPDRAGKAAAAVGGGIVVAVLVLAVFYYFFLLPGSQPDELDTSTRSYEVAGYYGRGLFTGDLLQSDRILINVTNGLSQSIAVQGEICVRVPGQGQVFFSGSKSTEPDAVYKVYFNGVLTQSYTMELGSNSALEGGRCFELPLKDFVLTNATTGSIKVEMVVYVFSFERQAGAYEVLAVDQAKVVDV